MANYQGKLASAIQRTFDNFEKSFDKSFEKLYTKREQIIVMFGGNTVFPGNGELHKCSGLFILAMVIHSGNGNHLNYFNYW